MKTNRRDFLKVALGLAAAGAPAWSQDVKSGTKAPRKIPLGVQLYAVRGAFEKDVPGTLKAVAEMGYKGVEFWGYGGTKKVFKNYGAQELGKMLDDNKLQCCGIHCGVDALKPENLQRSMDNAKILGSSFLNIAAAPREMESPGNIGKFAAFLNETARKAGEQRMRVGYHAHGSDFARIGDKLAYEILFEQLVPEVNMQVDIGHCINAGADPVAIFKKFPGRALTVHIREVANKKMAFDSPGYQELFKILETVAGTRWYIVEEEAGTDLKYSRTAIEKLHKLGK